MASGRIGYMPVCYSCEDRLGLKKKDQSGNHLVPPEVMPLIFSAKSAAEELGSAFELIDICRLPFSKRLILRLSNKPIPRVSIGEQHLVGSPTKQEIIELYQAYRRL
ncbi:MAG: hypothetical protein ACXAEF_02050 [Candidatus Thorarchaeota archaeon]